MAIFQNTQEKQQGADSLFSDFQNRILNIDPVSFVENNLTLDGKPFRLNGNGFKPFADIYRYIGLKAIEPDSKPVVLVKGRQVGATTMAAALECYFAGCGLYGNNGRYPMRIMHLFPIRNLATAYTKSKLNTIISSSKHVPGQFKSNGMPKSYMETKLDLSSPSNDSQGFKKFLDDNEIWIENTGLDGDRIRGRQLCLETEIPTPKGFVKLKDLKEGDQLFDEKGKVCNITKLHPINLTPEAYRITFDDGLTVDACAEHLWQTYTKRDRVNLSKFLKGKITKPPIPKIKNTKEILETLKAAGGKESNHSILNTAPIEYSKKELIIDPYLFGIWLGDGNRYGGIETADPDVLKGHKYRVVPSTINHKGNFGISKSCSYRVKDLTTKLTEVGVVKNPRNKNEGFYNKHIPDVYMYSSVDQRLALLQGLMDSDGCCFSSDHRMEFAQVREKLAYQVYELITSLGIKARINKYKSFRYGVRYQDKYKISFITEMPVFRLNRKLKNIKKDNSTNYYKRHHRYIKKIEAIKTKPMRCLTVDSPSHLFLITRSYLPTHNTVDAVFYDECFPYNQNIETIDGKIKIGDIYNKFVKKEQLPLVKTFNEEKEIFEYKKITNAWKRGEKELLQFVCDNLKIKCTFNHPFLTTKGWVKAGNLKVGDLIKTEPKNDQSTYGLSLVEKIKHINKKEVVYDIEVEDNHNFIVTSVKTSKYTGGLIAHNCQDMFKDAIGAASKILAQAKYGPVGSGLKVFFGTPKAKGGVYWDIWQKSSQQYYHLKCSKCNSFFPLYRPDVNWEDIWLYGFIVKCTECDHEQDKRVAAEHGKWIALNDEEESSFVGYHINQLYIPYFTKETIIAQKPENNPENSERTYMNEVLGEFFDGEGGTISVEEIRQKCGDINLKMVSSFQNSEKRTYLGFDWGQKAALEQLTGKKTGKSYSCGVVLTADGPQLFSVNFALRLIKTDPRYKREVVEEMFRKYRPALGVGDIGDAKDLTHELQEMFGERFLASRAAPKVVTHIKFNRDIFPKEIVFDRNYYISELLNLLKNGNIKFPFGHYDRIEWLVQHCASMDIKVTKNRSGDPIKHYVKGSTPNDGFMALLNAYLAWKFDVTQGFSIKQPTQMKYDKAINNKNVHAVLGYVPNSGVL